MYLFALTNHIVQKESKVTKFVFKPIPKKRSFEKLRNLEFSTIRETGSAVSFVVGSFKSLRKLLDRATQINFLWNLIAALAFYFLMTDASCVQSDDLVVDPWIYNG